MTQDSAGFTVLQDVECTDAAAPSAQLRTCGSACCTCTKHDAVGLPPASGRQRKYLAGGLLVLLVGVVLLACLVHGQRGGYSGGKGPGPAGDDAEFAIMLDAGSSGTRVHVYSWPVGSSCHVRITQRQVIERGNGLSVKPGLSSKAPVDVANYLQPLLDFAKSVVPSDKHSTTSVFLQATAGMRLLSQLEQDARIDAVWEAFRASPFRAAKANAAVISGQVEGANEWVTINYLRGTLGAASDTGCYHPPHEAPSASNPTKASATAVTLGMGGASTQIAFAPAASSDCPLEDPSTAFCVAFQDLGLGATEAQDTLRKGIVSGEGAASPVGDACLLADYTTAAEVNGKNVAFIGQGNYAACKQSIVTHVVQTQHPCKWRHCAFNGVFQPTLTAGDLHLNKEFYELSAFIFTVQFFGMKEGDPLSVLQSHAIDFCATPWASARAQHPEADEARLASYCFSSVYFGVLLEAYGVDSDRTSLRWADNIDGVSVDWPLGAVIRSTCATANVDNSTCRGNS